MIAQSPQRPISRGIRVAGTPTISAHKASNAIGFFRAFEKRRASGACGVRPRVDRSKPKGASSRDKETEGIWNTTRPPKRGRSRLTIGDRLTDNAADPDGYRYHDALHLGYVAVLGWSPVTRALLRLKRKSDHALDEQQDGARAIIIEEAITQQIFSHARDHKLFESIERLDYGLLKWLRRMVRGLEVESASAVEWQRAILEGYRAFRLLKEHAGGFLTIDTPGRTLRYRPTAPHSK